MEKKIPIAGPLTSATAEGFVADAKEIKYENDTSVFDKINGISTGVIERITNEDIDKLFEKL